MHTVTILRLWRTAAPVCVEVETGNTAWGFHQRLMKLRIPNSEVLPSITGSTCSISVLAFVKAGLVWKVQWGTNKSEPVRGNTLLTQPLHSLHWLCCIRAFILHFKFLYWLLLSYCHSLLFPSFSLLFPSPYFHP